MTGPPDWPTADLESVPRCPVCAGERRLLLHDRLADRVWFTSGGGWSLHRCLDCSSAFLDPRPDRRSIGRAYASYYTHTDAASQPPAVHARASMRNGYLNARYGYRFSPSSRLGAALGWLFPKKRSYADRSVRNLDAPQPGVRLLDIGCGEGSFLAEMRQVGWEVHGIEPDPRAAALARASGIPVVGAPLEEVQLPPESFDAVTMNHVIEHFHDPIGALRIARRLLKPGGILWLATPNLGSYGHARFGRDWVGLDPPRHLVLFTRNALASAVAATGFAFERFGSDYSAQCYFAHSATIAAGEDSRKDETLARHTNQLSSLVGDLVVRVSPARAENVVLIAHAERVR